MTMAYREIWNVYHKFEQSDIQDWPRKAGDPIQLTLSQLIKLHEYHKALVFFRTNLETIFMSEGNG